MRTRVFAGSFFGRTKVVSVKLNSRDIFWQKRELITAEWCRTENIDDVKWVPHEATPRASPRAFTTRSISTQAPSGSAATAIAVRAGKG